MTLRWADERYVRLYTRDTATRARLPWQARALHAEILRKVDRSGLLALDADEPVEALADLVRMPVDVVRDALSHLERKEWVTVKGDHLIVPNFLEAQEAIASDAARARIYRERKRLDALDQENVTNRDETVTERNASVTQNHAPSRAVTPYLSVPCLTVPNQDRESGENPPPLALESTLDLGKPDSKRQRAIVDHWLQPALQVLEQLNAARKRVIAGARDIRPTYSSLGGIAARLDAGKTCVECLAVIENCAEEVRRRSDAAQWFDAVSPWRPENFERKLAMNPIAADPKGARRLGNVGWAAPVENTAVTEDQTELLRGRK